MNPLRPLHLPLPTKPGRPRTAYQIAIRTAIVIIVDIVVLEIIVIVANRRMLLFLVIMSLLGN